MSEPKDSLNERIFFYAACQELDCSDLWKFFCRIHPKNPSRRKQWSKSSIFSHIGKFHYTLSFNQRLNKDEDDVFKHSGGNFRRNILWRLQRRWHQVPYYFSIFFSLSFSKVCWCTSKGMLQIFESWCYSFFGRIKRWNTHGNLICFWLQYFFHSSSQLSEIF